MWRRSDPIFYGKGSHDLHPDHDASLAKLAAALALPTTSDSESAPFVAS
jgi:hypothetical protein